MEIPVGLPTLLKKPQLIGYKINRNYTIIPSENELLLGVKTYFGQFNTRARFRGLIRLSGYFNLLRK